MTTGPSDLGPHTWDPRGGGRLRAGGIALLAALLGGGLVAGILAASGSLGGGTTVRAAGGTTTILESTPSTHPTALTSGLSAPGLYARTAPGVVDITAQSQSSGGFLNPFGQSEQTDTGTGFVVDDQGHILTAAHVVDGASSISVTFQDGRHRSAKLDGEDTSSDVAVLSVDPSGLSLHPLPLGSSRSLVVGDALAVIGDPFGYPRSLSTGVVAGLDRTIQAPNSFTIPHAIQTDAALNPGNSGGPVLDAAGDVVGIADQIATGSSGFGGQGQSSGVGFAVPIDIAKADLPTVEAGGHVAHAYLGISSADATSPAGVLVQAVQPGTPAAAAGLHAGDIILSIDGAALHGSNDLINALAGRRPGQVVTLDIQRGSRRLSVSVTLGTQPSRAGNG